MMLRYRLGWTLMMGGFALGGYVFVMLMLKGPAAFPYLDMSFFAAEKALPLPGAVAVLTSTIGMVLTIGTKH